ncbi:hypothetical protein MW887_002726 [Aspergillus wentii]|nr:hypothetical protein MW887_002726 [Aspergillus wentii]
MANGYSHLPGDLDVLQSDGNRSQMTILLPSPSPLKRVSTYYPKKGPEVLEESNADPFYLEQSLTDTGHWDSLKPETRDVRFNEDANQYFMLSTVNPAKDYTFPPSPVRRNTLRSRNINRSTLSVVELENDLGFQEFAAQRWERKPHHYSKGSFGSIQSEATPDLTPSSSFSSNYSAAPLHPDLVLKATDQLSLQAHQAHSETGNQIYLTPCTPPRSRSAVSTQPSTPTRSSRSNLETLNESSDTLVMSSGDLPPALSRRGKPLPTLPNLSRNANSLPNRKGPIQANRSQIEPSMISPPSLINPVTMEPHTSHFDQAFFIPAHSCPSPVPSPSATSPPITRQGTIRSSRDRPSTSTSDVFCEQSVWESDSDSESVGPKSLSRKPIDTLRKVRSRVHLRVAKSAPKLNSTSQEQPDMEAFPSIEHHGGHRFPERPATMDHPPYSRDALRPAGHQTLRLVAPSTTSLVRPRSRRDSQPAEYDIDRSTAAAIQAKSRRKQRSTSPEEVSIQHGEKVCMCHDDRSHSTIHDSLTLARPPLFKRIWESLRVLGCHSDMTTPKPSRKSF